jgi:hypothetical protein
MNKFNVYFQVLACQDSDPNLQTRKLCSERAITVARTKPLG